MMAFLIIEYLTIGLLLFLWAKDIGICSSMSVICVITWPLSFPVMLMMGAAINLYEYFAGDKKCGY